MLDLEIRTPAKKDIESINSFFEIVIKHTYIKEGLGDLTDDIENEIEDKKRRFIEAIETNGEERYFLIALDNNQIVATIECCPSNDIIIKGSYNELKDVIEIATVFVHPNYQYKGIGSFLLNLIYLHLMSKNVQEFCLDSGYSSAQLVWKKKFGDPDYVLKNYWGEGFDHMIWRRKVNDQSLQFKIS